MEKAIGSTKAKHAIAIGSPKAKHAIGTKVRAHPKAKNGRLLSITRFCKAMERMELDHLWPAIGGIYTSMGGIAWEEGNHTDSST